MLQKIDKKNYIFFYLIIFLILSSTHNSNLKFNNFFTVKKIKVVGLKKTDNLLLEKKFTNLIGSNIFELSKKSFEIIDSINLINSYKVKKIYPDQIKIHIESAVAIGVLKYLNELVTLGNNGKIIELESLPVNVPKVTGTEDIKKIFQTLQMIDKSNLEIENIKKIEFFPSGRIDVIFNNKSEIRFPIEFTIDNLNFGSRLLIDYKFDKSKVLDLRIPNKVISHD